MKRIIALLVAVMMLASCMCIVANAEGTVTFHYHYDSETLTDYYASDLIERFDMEKMMMEVHPEEEEHFLEMYGAWLNEDGTLDEESLKEDIEREMSVPVRLEGMGVDASYTFVANPNNEGWADAELPAGMNFDGFWMIFSNGYVYNMRVWNTGLPATADTEMWDVFTSNAEGNAQIHNITTVAPEGWDDGSTKPVINITANVPAVSYTIVIPEIAVVNEEEGDTNYLCATVGAPSVADVCHAGAKTVISYTAVGTDFVNAEDDSLTMAATYWLDADKTEELGGAAVTVYENGDLAEELKTIYVAVDEDVWNSTPTGTYNATLTFTFTVEEAE